MIPQSFIADLIARVDIVEVVGRYVQLKKGGANFMGLCPFHNEKSPSFTVSPTKQFYHCFGCGAHGTAIGFLMEYSGQGFVEAIKDLAQSHGMVVPENDQMPPLQRAEIQAKSLALSEAMTRASDYYRRQLKVAPTAIAYLQGRGLSGEIAAKFSLGYAPEGWDNLRQEFNDYDEPALAESGMVIDKEGEDGGRHKRYDRFRDRVMFPIKNTKGQVIGFGGRVMGSGEPKYLNSPETPLFQKGYELYGLFEARQAIRDAGYVLVTEGYMDVVALAQMGFPQAVATLGTACTPMHVQKLLRQTDQVIFSFDGDSAGRRAARRALDACMPLVNDSKTIKFLFLPTEHDPDSYIREYGAEVFHQIVQDAMPLSQFLLNLVSQDNDLTTLEGRAHTQFEAKPALQAMVPSSLRLQIVRGLAQLTQTTPMEIETMFELEQPVARVRVAPPRVKRNAPMGLERQMMRIILAHPPLAALMDANALLAAAELAPDGAQMLNQLVSAAQAMGKQAQFAALSDHLRNINADFDELIMEIAKQSETDAELCGLELTWAIRNMKMQQIKAEQVQLTNRGLQGESDKLRFYELKRQLDEINRQNSDEIALR
ncbi:DNA primase [Solimicrobium silvestre]|uniref:DNA primase n=1 Tax=Solimicrobium silvestre TaxID=2099400 RepID=A0A2S9GYM9_9BURK|nr:DNA primase [Solimicrobium silvestre]PRC92766.1 dnaG: DNA primase [Solimicrobium silvestre]